MARRFDPILKMWVDEPDIAGTVDPNAIPGIQPATPEFNQVAPGQGAGGGSAAVLQVIGSAQKPIREVETAEKMMGPQATAAETDLATAETDVNTARGRVSAVEEQEAVIEKQRADEAAAERGRALEEARLDEQAHQKRSEGWMADDDRAIEENNKAQLAVGNAPQSFWEGRPAAQFFTRLLLSVGGAAHDLSGQSGPSPVERYLNEQIQNHKDKLVTKWEATKEANLLKKTKRQEFEAELARRQIWAANQSLGALGLIDEQAKAAIAGLGKEKQSATTQLKTAELDEQRKRLKLERAEGYNRLKKVTENTYPDARAPGEEMWSNRPLTESEAKAHLYGREITKGMQTVGDSVLKRETIKRVGSNIAQLGKGPTEGLISNWLKRNDWSPAPDDFLDGVTDPKQREVARAWLNALNAKVRHESGAAIGTVENLSNIWRNGPTASSTATEQRKLRDSLMDTGMTIIPRNLNAKKTYDEAVAGREGIQARENDPKNWSDLKLKRTLAEAARAGKKDAEALEVVRALQVEIKRRKTLPAQVEQ